MVFIQEVISPPSPAPTLPPKKGSGVCNNLDEYSDIGTHWIALYVQNNGVPYYDYFGVEHIPKEIRTFICNKNIKTNILE